MEIKHLLSGVALTAYYTAQKRGKRPKDLYDGIAYIQEEIGEVLKETQPHYYSTDSYGHAKPEGYLVEIGDIAIAALSLLAYACEGTDKMPGEILMEKMAYNRTRED